MDYLINTHGTSESSLWSSLLKRNKFLEITYFATSLSADELLASLAALKAAVTTSSMKIKQRLLLGITGGLPLISESITLSFLMYVFIVDLDMEWDAAAILVADMLLNRRVPEGTVGFPDAFVPTFRDDWVRLSLVLPSSVLLSRYVIKQLSEERVALLEK